jgi:hypothetical protein
MDIQYILSKMQDLFNKNQTIKSHHVALEKNLGTPTNLL